MSLEIERNFYNYKTKDLLNKIKENGGKIKFARLFRIYLGKHGDMKVRLRDEVVKKTFVLKHKNKGDVYETEHEIIVSDIDKAKVMLNLLGIEFPYYHEKIRIAYSIQNSELAFDFVVGDISYVQIESPNENELTDIAQKLGLTFDDPYPNQFVEYGIDETQFNKIQNFSFSNIHTIADLVTKNKEKYNKMVHDQLKLYKRVTQ